MAKPYFPRPGGDGGYREPAAKPLEDPAPPPPEQPPKREVLVTRPDDPDVARAKAAYGNAKPPAADSLLWLRPVAVMFLILVIGIQIALALRTVVRPRPRPVPSAAPTRFNTLP